MEASHLFLPNSISLLKNPKQVFGTLKQQQQLRREHSVDEARDTRIDIVRLATDGIAKRCGGARLRGAQTAGRGAEQRRMGPSKARNESLLPFALASECSRLRAPRSTRTPTPLQCAPRTSRFMSIWTLTRRSSMASSSSASRCDALFRRRSDKYMYC